MNADGNSRLPPVIFVLGGARSGKSDFGQDLVQNAGGQPVFIATARVADDEMADRIQRHKSARGPNWRTIEADIDLVRALGEAQGSAVLVDCLTLWLANVMEDGLEPDGEIRVVINALAEMAAPVVLISNEVGQGIVPANPLARKYRDIAGRMNQTFAGAADQVFFVTAGIAQRLK